MAATAPPSCDDAAPRWCVVTGGRGFLARHLVSMLLRSDEGWHVRVADLAPAISLDPTEEDGLLGQSLRSGRAAYVSADLRNKAQVLKAFEDAEVVFHMAAPDSSINNYQLHYSVNVEGTKNVIDACVQCKVKRLIYTSSPSVLFSGEAEIFNADETMPYPRKFNDSYSETKAEGEKLVMNANGREGLLTCCIRPSGIFGPGDKLLVPSLVAAARTGKSKYIIGDGDNIYDFTYVENVAHGHICAERTLSAGENSAKTVGGKAYFITNAEPIKFWEFMSLILEGLGYERPCVKIPVSVAMPLAHVVEWTYKAFSRYGMPVPQLTPSRIRLLSRSRTFSCVKAKGMLGYEPIVSLEDGLKRTVESYSYLRAQKKSMSKASAYLGNGTFARIFLWKDKKQTLTVLLFVCVIYYHLLGSGYTFVTGVAKLLSLFALLLFVHGMLPPVILGYRVEKLEPSNFHMTQERAYEIAHSVGSCWNSCAEILKSICRGEDWHLFLKVVFVLLAIHILAVVPHGITFKLGVPFLFFAFLVYENYEEAIDKRAGDARAYALRLKSNIVEKYLKNKQA